jgi:hypothetical protein
MNRNIRNEAVKGPDDKCFIYMRVQTKRRVRMAKMFVPDFAMSAPLALLPGSVVGVVVGREEVVLVGSILELLEGRGELMGDGEVVGGVVGSKLVGGEVVGTRGEVVVVAGVVVVSSGKSEVSVVSDGSGKSSVVPVGSGKSSEVSVGSGKSSGASVGSGKSSEASVGSGVGVGTGGLVGPGAGVDVSSSSSKVLVDSSCRRKRKTSRRAPVVFATDLSHV